MTIGQFVTSNYYLWCLFVIILFPVYIICAIIRALYRTIEHMGYELKEVYNQTGIFSLTRNTYSSVYKQNRRKHKQRN